MSWHFSQVLVEEYSAAICSDGALSALLNSMPTAQDDSCSDRMNGTCHLSPFGTMFVPSTDDLGVGLLTWYRLVSLAKTFQSSGGVPELTESLAVYGEIPPASFAKYDPSAHGWKTAQLSLLGGLEEFSQTWPQWGFMQHGVCWELHLSEQITNATVSGLLPTPLKNDSKGGTASLRKDGKSRLGEWRHYVRAVHGLTYPHPTHSELRMGWPEGWSDFKPLATDKFQRWSQLHSISCVEG